MNRYIIGSLWDRNNRNGTNANFEYLFEGRRKIDELNQRAGNILNEAQRTNDKNVDVQKQIDNLILRTGESDAEVINARGDFELLRHRLDNIDEFGEKLQSNLGWNLKNIIENGDFRNNLTGWSASGSATIDTTTSLSSGKSLKIDSTNGNSSQVTRNLSSELVVGHKYFISAKVKVDSYTSGRAGYQFDGKQESVGSTTDGFIELSNIHEYVGNNPVLYVGGMSSATLKGYVDSVQLYDVTEIFGFGNEVGLSLFLNSVSNNYIEGETFVGVPIKDDYMVRSIRISDSQGRQTFIDEMNEKAKRLGMNNSNFVNPQGFHHPDHKSTAKDLLKLGLAAAEKNDMVEIWSKAHYSFKTLGSNSRTIDLVSTLNEPALTDYYTVVGGKTGTANYINSLVSVVEGENGEWIVGVVQGDRLPRFGVSKIIYDTSRSAIKANQDTLKTPKSIVKNGDFSDGLKDFTINSGNPSVSNKKLVMNSTGTSQQLLQKINVIPGNKYYISADINVTRYVSGVAGFSSNSLGSSSPEFGLTRTTSGVERVSEIREGSPIGDGNLYVGSLISANLDGTLDNIVIVDLTSFYGAGFEPTKEEFEANDYDYFTTPKINFETEAENVAVCVKPVNSLAYINKELPILLSKNENIESVPGSTTKILSVLTALEHIDDLDEVIDIKSTDIVADGIEIFSGERMTIRDALHCMMLPSSNIAAMAIARHVGEKIAKRNLIR